MAGVAAIIFMKQRVFIATLFFSGFTWAIPLRHFTGIHDYQSIFYIGLPLTVFFFSLSLIPRRIYAVFPIVAVSRNRAYKNWRPLTVQNDTGYLLQNPKRHRPNQP